MQKTGKKVASNLFKIELGLKEDILKKAINVQKTIGVINTDIADIKKAFSTITMIKTDIIGHDNIANDLLKDILKFEDKTRELGVDLPEAISSAGNDVRELLKTNDILRKLIESNIK